MSDELKPAGFTAAMPGSNGGFSMCVFESGNIPVGAPLYAEPPRAQPDAEVVAFIEAAKALRLGVREAGVKREPAIYERVMRFDAALAALEGQTDAE